MSYRNGIYVAFNGCQTTDVSKSDIHYFNIMKAWNNNNSIDFKFSDSHAKTYQVRDSSAEKTLRDRLSQRMRDSKALLVIVTENTNSSESRIDWEIDQAVRVHNLPIIVAYTMKKGHLSKEAANSYYHYLPKQLAAFIRSSEASVLHIAFEKGIIKWAINNQTVHKNLGVGSWVLTKSDYDIISNDQ